METFIEMALRRITRETQPGALSVIALRGWSHISVATVSSDLKRAGWRAAPGSGSGWRGPHGHECLVVTRLAQIEGHALDGIAIVEPDTVKADIAARSFMSSRSRP